MLTWLHRAFKACFLSGTQETFYNIIWVTDTSYFVTLGNAVNVLCVVTS